MGFVLGLGGPYHHDASAALVHDGRIVAFAEEERFSRRKHHRDSRSAAAAAAWCLRSAGIGWAEVDEVAVAWNPSWPQPVEEITDEALITELLGPIDDPERPRRCSVVAHHLAHAASAFFPAGVADAAVLVVDGSGDGVSTSIHHGTPAGLRTLREWPFTQSLGWFYQAATTHAGLGDWTHAGKLMGLAAYGRPVIDLSFLRPARGGYHLDLSRYGLAPATDEADRYSDFSYYRDLQTAYAKAFTDAGIPAQRGSAEAHLGPAADLAASAQLQLQRCMLSLAETAVRTTGSSVLCLAGGVALNCTTNGILARTPGISELIVQPAASDSGCAVGAALHGAHRRGDLSVPGARQTFPLLGPEHSNHDVEAALHELGAVYSTPDDIATTAAQLLARGKIIGWHQGRSEAGPRALGARSILADPRSPLRRDRINREIKRRESWRPLAPSMLDLTRWTITPHGPAEAMIVAHDATEAARQHVPAVVHADATLRPQLVDPARQPGYARLLTAFAYETGVDVLLNTSFNGPGQPIVETPVDALTTAAALGLDAVVIGDYLITPPAADLP
ncbi:carbamoyltransferase family protein [Nocardia puris]|uniref:Carbamoyltransferase n=1 Tax=Nocardia puris TaxID=208602 RepID=A0A366D7N4_9NOCA|nr:carbamoyltransferase C-terminal domain-containing protein [Nocardia puris]RBO85288.1 carbamoyltransferase [Nocardia puris]